MREVWIIDAVRTPIGRYGGAFKDVRPDDLGAHVIKSLVERTGIDPVLVDDVIMGCANQAGEDNRNVARMSLLLAGLPTSVPGVTVNRLCASGLEAVIQGARAVMCGEADVIIAGGVESMTRAPFVMAKPEQAYPRGDMRMFDTTIGWRFTNKKLADMYHPYSMGETAENVAEQYNISREDQDAYALSSQEKAIAAIEAGKFKNEIVPVTVPMKKGDPVVVETDEHPRSDTSKEKLAKLRAAFREGGSVTAGNASGINDGAAAILVMSREKAESLGLKPIARYLAGAAAGVDPSIMGVGPIPAVKKALHLAKLSVDDIDLFEINEAFASQVLASVRELGVPLEKVNPNGGGIALGHPLGATGARMVATLVHEMKREGHRYGVTTMCIGVGQGLAGVFERVE
ncbi:acetyl-CoA C-acyltransferase [Tumebacillus sp. DT12]|uniref:acetyl-CoA C-acyltransferase n=1 Tax=Tumebacillus lacus TaxID=2995335 RepID=A0ABT3X961_9BACL|nr:acetyl-CoA C-acyltransferase [Tumebacillus lacus]MCX7572196.1 acetyl-CoA C-acyltransferase [Tumebacillus lacus]